MAVALALLVRATAPPVDARANRAMCRLIAEHVGVAPSQVSILRGGHGRDKVVEVAGPDPAALDDALRRG